VRELTGAIEALSFGLVAVTARAIGDASPRHALTFQQWRILVILGSSTGGLRIGEIARRIDASPSSTSRLVQRLAARKLVRGERDPRDGRAIRLHRSAAGADLYGRVIRRRRQLIRESLKGHEWDPVLAAEVQRLAAAFERWL
jgi:DNA-binding MarR family transcriptional regulator